uniref:Transcription initiation factor TFIID subunit 2 n=1 Tax=Ditylenchus dipsaci TaxID=166011 RepID=A0A915CSX7_9BILA
MVANDAFQFPAPSSSAIGGENHTSNGAATPAGFATEAYNCNFSDHSSSSQSPFRVLSQTVHVSAIDFEKRSFRVYSEIALIGVRTGLAHVKLDLGKNCLLPGEEGFHGTGQITINDYPAIYIRNKLKMPDGKDVENKSVLNLKNIYQKSLTAYPGDLIVQIPEQCALHLANQLVLRLAIDIFVLSPTEGVNFVWNGKSIEEDPGAHMYTYRSSILSSTKQWLPCFDSPNQLAVWRFEFTVDSRYTVVCSGDLIDTIPVAEDESQKTFHYQLLLPTSAINIGFAIGQFQMHVQPDIPEIISFCLPGLMPLLKHTVSTLNRTYTFFEELLSCRFPYQFYRQVFVNQVPDEVTTYAGLSILSLELLYHKKILDIVQSTRQSLALAIAQQFFGCFVNPADFGELWLVKSLARLVCGLFVERSFGTSEYQFQMNKMLRSVCEYENRFGKIVISQPPVNMSSSFLGKTASIDPFLVLHFDSTKPETCSSLYADALFKKGHFLMHMLQKRLGKDQFVKILHRILSVAMQYSQHLMKPVDWFHMVISGDSFFRTVTNVTSREFPTFIEQWVHTGGHVHFQVSYTFNRKHSKLELELKQDLSRAVGLQNYVGPLTIVVQEVDGCFTHTVQVDATISKHDLQCHSKGRRMKKKRVPLTTGEEIEIDLSLMDADSPVLWIRIDPEMLIPRQLQFHAIEMLHQYPVHQTKTVLAEVVENDRFFYKVRSLAARRLVEVCNRLPEAQMDVVQIPLIVFFQRLFGCKVAPRLPQSNNYVATSSNLQNYFLMLDLPMAIAMTRASAGRVCPHEVLDFLLGLIKYNDNSANRYSDDFYRAALILSLSSSLVTKEHASEQALPETMSQEAKSVLTEVTHALNMDSMKPSFGRVVGVRCLHVLLNETHSSGHGYFWRFALSTGIHAPMRRSALDCIISMVRQNKNPIFAKTVLELLHLVLNDSDSSVKYSVLDKLCLYPPFLALNDPLQTLAFPMNSPQLAQICGIQYVMSILKREYALCLQISTFCSTRSRAAYQRYSPLRASDLLAGQAVQEAKGASPISNNSLAGTPKSPSHRNPHARRKSGDLIPDSSILIDLEAHARSISSNIDMVLRDLRGSLRGMSDLTLESTQVFSSSIGSACDVVDTSIKATYTMLAKSEELNSSMEGVHKLAQQVKDMKRLLDLLETHFANESTAFASPATTTTNTSTN